MLSFAVPHHKLNLQLHILFFFQGQLRFLSAILIQAIHLDTKCSNYADRSPYYLEIFLLHLLHRIESCPIIRTWSNR